MTIFLSILAVFCLATFTLAAPVVEAKRGVDEQLFATFNLMEQYSSAAYCSNNYNSSGDKVICSAGNCDEVQAADTITLVEFASKLDTDVTGFVAIDNTNKLVVTSFRGSSSVDNWITNLEFGFVDTDLCSDCTAHEGFWQSWLDSRNDILAAIKNSSATNPTYKLVVTGHSLGGAIASLATAQLRNDGYDVGLYTFGAPRIAGEKLSDYITNQPGGNYRVTHWNDPVPQIPLIAMGFAHISPEYYINKGNLKTAKLSDIEVFQGNKNTGGNAKWLFTDIVSHLWYFNSISQCSINSILGIRDVDD